MSVRGYTLGIDWSQAGLYTGTGEDVSSRAQRGDIEIAYGRATDGDVTLRATAGEFSFALNNNTRYLSPENTASPITGKVLPGRKAIFQKWAPNGTLYTLLAGVLDSFSVDSDAAFTFSGSVVDAFGAPSSKQLSTALYSGIRTGTAIGVVLDEIGWTGPRDIDPGATVMPWWWEEGTTASDAIDKIVASEGPPAIAYVQGGVFVFRDRHHRLFYSRSTTSQATATHITPAGTGPVGDLKIEKGSWTYDHGVGGIVNSAVFSVELRAASALAEVWSSDEPLAIAAGTTSVQTIQGSDPFFGAITPVLGQDLVVQYGNVTGISISRTSGATTVLSISVSADTVITRSALRAIAVPVRRTVVVSATDASSNGIFGTRSWPDDSNPVWANQYDAQAIATKIVATYATYRPLISFSIYALTDTYLNKLLDLRISDRITVRIDPIGVTGSFMIERIAHKIKDLRQHRVVLTCVATEPVQPTNALTFGVAGKGFDQGAFAVDGIDNVTTMLRFDTAGQGFDQGLFAT